MTARSGGALLLLALAGPAAWAQSSEFGVRGLGLPGLPISAAATGTAGAMALFDPASALNPASLSGTTRAMASFSLLQTWRTSENRFGDASGRDSQFPLFFVAGPISRRVAGSVSASVYTDRTFGLASQETLSLGGREVLASDSLQSRGGITDVRAALAVAVSPAVSVGVGLHLLTGVNRIQFNRFFDDSSFIAVSVKNELQYTGTGISAGLLVRATRSLQLAGMVRYDGRLSIDKDTTDLGSVPLPVTLGAGLRWSPAPRLLAAAHVVAQRWSRLDAELKERGGTGAENTIQAAGGLEWFRSRRHPGLFPLRAGVRWAQLPFPATPGSSAGQEVVAAFGSGFSFSDARGRVNFSLERTWRSGSSGFTERSVGLRLGVEVQP